MGWHLCSLGLPLSLRGRHLQRYEIGTAAQFPMAADSRQNRIVKRLRLPVVKFDNEVGDVTSGEIDVLVELGPDVNGVDRCRQPAS